MRCMQYSSALPRARAEQLLLAARGRAALEDGADLVHTDPRGHSALQVWGVQLAVPSTVRARARARVCVCVCVCVCVVCVCGVSLTRGAVRKNAAVKGHADVVDYLLGRYVDFARANGGTREDVVELIDRADSRGRTALWDACRFGHVEVVRALLGAGADPTLQNDEGLDALAISKSVWR